jgi:HEAT repeat protein
MREPVSIVLAALVMGGLNVLLVLLTVGVKAARSARRAWYAGHFRRIEPALENYAITGEDQPELEALRPWQRDLFVSRLIAERIVLVRGAGREYLMRLAERLGLVDRYLKELGSWRRSRRARAAQNLGFFGGERCVRPLARLLSDRDETVRAVAARALARAGTPEVAEIMARTLDDSSKHTRLRVAENLERIGRPAVKPLVETLEGSREAKAGRPHGPIQAAQVLGYLRAAEARPALGHAALSGRHVDLRAQSALALGKIGDPDDVDGLRRAAGDGEWPVRAQAATALGMIGDISTIPLLKTLTAEREWWVSLNASRALANLGPAGELALVEILEGPDPPARQRAAATLEERGTTRRMVRELAAPGGRGERARRTVQALISAGITRHLRHLAQRAPDGEEVRALRELLEEDGGP